MEDLPRLPVHRCFLSPFGAVCHHCQEDVYAAPPPCLKCDVKCTKPIFLGAQVGILASHNFHAGMAEEPDPTSTWNCQWTTTSLSPLDRAAAGLPAMAVLPPSKKSMSPDR